MFGDQLQEITMEEARAYMLELVNRDRATLDLQPLVLDEYATTAAQWHAEDMALKRYISHWNTDGFTPTMRYTGGGGRDGVTENVTYFECGTKLFLTRKVVEYMEYKFMGSEGHRENLMRPEHNRIGVGIGFALLTSDNLMLPEHNRLGVGIGYARHPDGYCVFTCDQTFVSDYGEMGELPQSVVLGTPITITGRLDTSRVDFRYIVLSWNPFPQPITPEVLNANLQGGTDVGDYNIFFANGADLPAAAMPVANGVEWNEDTGEYRLTVDFSSPLPGTIMPSSGGPGTPGVYFISVWATLDPDLIPEGWENRDDYFFKASVWTMGGVYAQPE